MGLLREFALAWRGSADSSNPDWIVAQVATNWTAFGNQVILNEQTSAAPSLCRWNEMLCIAWTSTNVNRKINVAELCVPSYQVRLLYDPNQWNKPGSTVAITLQMRSFDGKDNVSAAQLPLKITGLYPKPDPGKAPSGTFAYLILPQGPGYQLNVDTTGYRPSSSFNSIDYYELSFTAGSDPATHTATFKISPP